MTRALVMAIACAMAASAWATSDGDYTGARMPHYRMDYESRDTAALDDYPERSPDAPVPSEYKYEEDPGEKLDRIPETDAQEIDGWHKTKKRRNKPIDVEPEYSQGIDKYSSTDDREQKVKPNRVQLRNRHSFKIKKFDIYDETFTERDRRRYYEDLKDPSRDNDVHNKRDDRLRNGRNFDRNMKVVANSRGERRSGRRNIRDKAMPLIDDTDEGVLVAEKEFDTDDSGDEDSTLLTGQRRTMVPERVRVTQPDPDFTTKFGYKKPDKSFADYDEYYDMKRVLNIKNKLPVLLRRTKATYRTTQSTLHLTDWFRRANVPDGKKDLATDNTPSAPSTIITTESTITTQVTAMTTAKIIATTRKTTPKSTTKPSYSSELSFAEKSRLSILRKAQSKESLKSGTATIKPPVLMQVTQRMQTLVMVEPPGSHVQRMQAREIANDSPSRVAKAKSLMRHKLLSNAKSIHELTDNWDDMVCEYIDVSLLNEATTLHPCLFYKYIILLYIRFYKIYLV